MRYWLFCISPDTYPGVLKYNTVGVRENAKKRFKEIKKGDAYIVYVSREKVFRGYGAIESDTFEDDTLIFSEEKVFPNRAKVSFIDTEAEIPAYDMIFGLTPFLESVHPANLMMCKGGFIEIEKEDYEKLISEILRSK
jgi:hypothetical protein